MKMKIISGVMFTVFLCVCPTFFSFADELPAFNSPEKGKSSGWQLQNRLPTSEALSGIYFINNKEGWAAGGNGIVLHTTDGGETWNILAKIQDKDLLRLYFFDSKKGVALGWKGSIFKTEDGGKSWKLIFNNPDYWLENIQILKDKIIISASDSNDSSVPVAIFLSDADDSYSIRRYTNIKLMYDIYGFSHPMTVFIDEKNIITGGRRLVFLSNDGGNTWKRVYEFPHPYPFHRINIFFRDTRNGFIFADNVILTTSDGGLTWNKSLLGDRLNNIRKIAFFDKMNGVAVGFNQTRWDAILLRTYNGGKTWKEDNGFKDIYGFYDIMFTDEMNGWIAGAGGTILHTGDGGTTWKSQTAGFPQSFRDGFFIDKNTGWVIGGDYQQSSIIIRTVDGGKIWKKQYEEDKIYLNAIKFTNRNTGWVTGREGVLLQTRDGGENWNRIHINTKENLFSVEFLDDNNGWIFGEYHIFKTMDGGNSWTRTTFMKNCRLDMEESYLISKKRCIIFGLSILEKNEQYIFHKWNTFETANGGLTWQKSTRDLGSQFFFKSGKGWKCTSKVNSSQFEVFYSNNFGTSWVPIGKLPSDESLSQYDNTREIFFIDSRTGYIILWNRSDIYKTTDGGKTWTHRNSGIVGLRNKLNKIIFVDPDNGWILGDFGTILHTTTGGE